MLKINDQIPLDIPIKDHSGKVVSLRDFLGSVVVLYTYPKDDTPGCIKEACSLRDLKSEFEDLGVKVFGISPDDTVSHQKFIKKYDLTFQLLVDTDQVFLKALGVWGERSFMGKKYMGVERTTFLIDQTGKIIYVWEKVKPEGHGEKILEEVKSQKLIRKSS